MNLRATLLATMVLSISALAMADNHTRDLFSGAHGPADPAEWIRAINEYQPDAVIITMAARSHLVNPEQLSAAIEGRVLRFRVSAGMSPWQYLVVKNVLDWAEHKPRLVILLTADDHITRPDKGAILDYSLQINALHGRHNRGAQRNRRAGSMFIDYVVEPELQTLSYGNNPLPHSIDNSYLPYLVQLAAENGFRLAVVRERFYPVTDERAEAAYLESLRRYMAPAGLAFIEAGDDVVEQLKALMEQSPPAAPTLPVLPRAAAFAPQVSEWLDEPAPETDPQLARGLIGHWRLDGAKGPRVVDSSPNALHGLMHGGMTYESSGRDGGPVGRALQFDGIDQCVEIRSELMERLPAMTLSFWVNFEGPSAGNTYQTLVGDSHFYRGLFIYCGLNQDGASPVFASYHPRRHNLGWGHQLVPGEWTHLVAVFDGEHKITYVNGVETNRAAHTGDIIGAGGIFLGWNVNVYYFRGMMDEVRLYDRALSAEEIQRLSAQGGR